mmetsp:Transcript_4286/g.10134  ORF Transcript_4286/g.10134 Transcript_4286/m.10134 type:complete len:213 (+) Transcript_4286:1302-1940(+)
MSSKLRCLCEVISASSHSSPGLETMTRSPSSTPANGGLGSPATFFAGAWQSGTSLAAVTLAFLAASSSSSMASLASREGRGGLEASIQRTTGPSPFNAKGCTAQSAATSTALSIAPLTSRRNSEVSGKSATGVHFSILPISRPLPFPLPFPLPLASTLPPRISTCVRAKKQPPCFLRPQGAHTGSPRNSPTMPGTLSEVPRMGPRILFRSDL